MEPVKKTGITQPSTTGKVTGSGASQKPKVAKAQTPTAQDEAVLTGKDTKANVSAATRTGALQGTRKARKNAASDSDADVNDFQAMGSLLGNQQGAAPNGQATGTAQPEAPVGQATGTNQAGQVGGSSQVTPEGQGAAMDMQAMIGGASMILGQNGVKVTPDQLAQALQTAQQNGSQDLVGTAAKALNIDPEILGKALGQSEMMMKAHNQATQLAAILSQKLGKTITAEQVATAYAQAGQEMQNGGANVFQGNAGVDVHQLAAQKLGIDPAVLHEAINQIGQNQGQSPDAAGGGTTPGGVGQPPSGGTQPPGGTPPGGPTGGDSTLINQDYLQKLQGMMGGLGINIPPQIMQAQQQMMNQLYGYGLMQQSVQTQRAGLEQYMQVMNTVLQMNLSVMQNQNLMLNMVVDARQQMYQMNQQMIQNMFTKTMQAGEGWIKAFGGGGG